MRLLLWSEATAEVFAPVGALLPETIVLLIFVLLGLLTNNPPPAVLAVLFAIVEQIAWIHDEPNTFPIAPPSFAELPEKVQFITQVVPSLAIAPPRAAAELFTNVDRAM